MISKTSRNEAQYEPNSFQKIDNSNNIAKKIILANKGEASYLPVFDLNNDSIITLEEFNEYCSENGIDESDKLKILTAMNLSKNAKVLEEKKQNNNIYAKKGDKKYVDAMDENKNSIITYEEYIKYCEKHANSTRKETGVKSIEFKKAIKAYSNSEIQQEEIKVDSEA